MSLLVASLFWARLSAKVSGVFSLSEFTEVTLSVVFVAWDCFSLSVLALRSVMVAWFFTGSSAVTVASFELVLALGASVKGLSVLVAAFIFSFEDASSAFCSFWFKAFEAVSWTSVKASLVCCGFWAFTVSKALYSVFKAALKSAEFKTWCKDTPSVAFAPLSFSFKFEANTSPVVDNTLTW